MAIKIDRGIWKVQSIDCSSYLLQLNSAFVLVTAARRTWEKNATECPARAARINRLQPTTLVRLPLSLASATSSSPRRQDRRTVPPNQRYRKPRRRPAKSRPPPATEAAPPAAEVGITLMLATFVTRWPHHHNYFPLPTGHQPPRRRHRAAPCHRPPLHSYPATKPPPNHHAPTLAAHKQIRSQHTGAALYAWTIAGIAHTRHRHHAS